MSRALTSVSAAVAAFVLAAQLSPALAAAPVSRTLFNVPGMISAYAYTFCGEGVAAGAAINSSWVTMAFSYDAAGHTLTYSVPGSTYTEARGCYQGRFLGSTVIDGVRQGYALAADGSVQLVSPTDGGFTAVTSANAAGALVGTYWPTDKGGSRASGFVVHDGVFTRYDVDRAIDTRLVQITEDGTLLGNYSAGLPFRSVGFIDRQGVREDIKIPGAYSTYISGMNSRGQVVGYFDATYGSVHKGFVWQDGKYKTFSMTPTGNTFALGIDDKSSVIGYFIDTSDYSSSNFVIKLRP
jgi:probable HAF family extracellular repeat protein